MGQMLHCGTNVTLGANVTVWEKCHIEGRGQRTRGSGGRVLREFTDLASLATFDTCRFKPWATLAQS
jgi:hypothetical protein